MQGDETMQEPSITTARDAFRARFETDPDLVALAPGRVNLIGDHVDYAGGLVLPIAIDRATSVALAVRNDDADGESRILAVDLGREVRSDLSRGTVPVAPGEDAGFANYVTGPADQLRAAGLVVPPMDIVIASSVPMGGGLSSSAALEVAVLLGIRTRLGADTSPLTIAMEARRAEHQHAGTPCGIMDMYVSAAARRGNACLIDCTTNELLHVAMPSPDDAVIMITDTGTRHALNEGAYARRRADCEEAARALGHGLLAEASTEEIREAALTGRLRSRARHVVEETARVRTFVDAVEASDLETAGRLMFESHESLRDLFEVSCPELDLLVHRAAAMRNRGVLGARMTGGGFGGCVVSLCRPGRIEGIERAYRDAFKDAFGRQPVSFITSAADGARIV